MQQLELLTPDRFYHIYNRGINGCNLFLEKANYQYFLTLYGKHILPVAETYAWVLMKNHFHLLVKIKDEAEILNPQGLKNVEGLKSKLPSQSFSNLFNAYSKAINKRYGRTVSLFKHPFKRKLIEDKEYLKTVIVYIHNNPVHHSFTRFAANYRWSSYTTCISDKPNLINLHDVIGLFGDKDNFKHAHDYQSDNNERV